VPLAAELHARLSLADGDPHLAEALDRWELSLFKHDPFRSEQLRASLAALLGGTWPLRTAVLVEESPEERASLHAELAELADGAAATDRATDAVRRALVAVLSHGDRGSLARELDGTLLGVGVGLAGGRIV
jgi:hypothetical protein